MAYDNSANCNTEAAAIRFQRVSIALFSLAAVVLNEPIPAMLVILTSAIAVINLKAELFSFFYKNIVRRIFGRDIFRFTHLYPGSFFLASDTERFILTVIGIIQNIGAALHYSGTKMWFVPSAIVTGGTTISATTGICQMGFMYAVEAFLKVLKSYLDS